MPKFSFALRSAPAPDINDAAVAFDTLVDKTWEDRFGLSFSPEQRLQWALPVDLGGSGLVLAYQCSLPGHDHC